MKRLKILFFMLSALITGILHACWQVMLFLVDLIDGGDEETESFPTDNTIHYNYRTGNIDPVKHLDGLYNSKP